MKNKIVNLIRRILGIYILEAELKSIKGKIDVLYSSYVFLRRRNEILEQAVGKTLIQLNATKNEFNDCEFRIYSQFGDDGLIQYLINNVDIKKKIFIEFGVEDYSESNTRFLLFNDNWEGFIMDGNENNIQTVIKSGYYWRHSLIAKHAFVTKENINSLLTDSNFYGNIGLLHIDIDGNDYWVWKEIDAIDPDIVIIEYNSTFGIDRPITIPYTKNFNRTEAHFSNLYWGSSLLSLCDLASEKGYGFVGCNNAGNNAYFVKDEKLGNVSVKTIEEGYVESKYRESKDINGNLTFLDRNDRKKILRGIEVFNTRTNTLEKF